LFPYDHTTHVPDGFHRIRYYGFLGNSHRARKLARCRELLRMAPTGSAVDRQPADCRDRYAALAGRSSRECGHRHTGIMAVIGCVARATRCQPAPDSS
jgi:hypothetical protein